MTLFGKRVNAEGVAPVALQPTPIPGSTYVRPAQVPAGGAATQIADALGNLNKGLLAYGSMAASLQQDPSSRANKAFENGLYGKSIDELRAMADAGQDLPQVQHDALSVILGNRVGDEFQQGLPEWYSSDFDQASGDLAKQLDGRRREVMQGLPNDAARAAFWKSTDGYVQRFLAGDTERKIKEATGERNAGVLSMYRNIVTEGLHSGKDNSAIVGEVMAAGRSNRTFAKLDGPSQNAILYQLAQEMAVQGRPELVKALLTDQRGGIGPLLGTADYSVSGHKLIEAAQTAKDKADADGALGVLMQVDDEVRNGTFTAKRGEELRKANPWMSANYVAGQVDQSSRARASAEEQAAKAEAQRVGRARSEAQRNTVMANAWSTAQTLNGFNRLKDAEVENASGTGTTTVTAHEQQQFVVQTFLDRVEQQRKANLEKMTPEQADEVAFQAKLQWFAGNGAVNPEWDAALNNMHVIASPALLANGGDIPPEVGQAAELYRRLYTANPSYAARVVDDKRAEKFFEAYRFAREDGGALGGMTESQALRQAAQVAAMPASASEAVDVSNKQIDAALDTVDFSTLMQRLWGGDGWEPNAADKGRMRELIKGYIAQGMPFKTAQTRAAERMHDTSVLINGRLVPSNDRAFPGDFKPIVEKILDAYADQHKDDEGIASGADLYVAPIGPREWAIVKKDGGPVESGTAIRMEDINAYRSYVEEAKKFDTFSEADAARRGYSKYEDGGQVLWKDGEGRLLKPSLKDGTFSWTDTGRKAESGIHVWGAPSVRRYTK